ncbi:MAG: ATP-binding protein [Gordonia polyisoprenivorans]|nr:ATP-binding protein [Gordonia polyisoprenivorans]
MDASVYTPGAGHLPPVLAGRDDLLHAMAVRLNDVANVGRTRSEDVVFTGVRGVGKTAMLTAYSAAAAEQGFEVISYQAVTGQSGLVDSILARAALRIDQEAGAWTRARRALDRISGVSLGVAGVNAGVNVHEPTTPARRVYPEALAEALATLALEVRRDAPGGGVLITVDEMQVAAKSDLPLLAATLHRLNVEHPQAAVAFAGTGLPHVPTVLREAGVTHPDRLFLIEELASVLSPTEARYAIIEPARRAGVALLPDAADRLVELTNGYPAHLQLFADEAWHAAPGPSVITIDDVDTGARRAGTRLVRQSLGPRLNELPPRQLEYLTALALHGGAATTRAIAETLGRQQRELSWIRDELLRAGDIYAPTRGRVVMSVPAFAPFLLAHYDDAREATDTPLLELRTMRTNSTDGGQAPPPPLERG